jgi:acyl transferase domain-containing protein/acyl carrier protein
MACRLPGGASLVDFWSLLCAGRSATKPVPAGRWNADAVFDADPKAAGKTNTRNAGFIDDIDRFDAAFFGISPREATQMDPQQRILLELAYEALEDAGHAPASLAGSDTAVFVGAMTNDYFRRQLANNYKHIDVHTGSGAGLCMLANRLSYQFDLHGPSASIDTACSSSLVAVFQACQSLWAGQARLALAAGVNLMLDPALHVFYAKAGLSAPDGKCKTFSAAADGIGRAEGGAVVVLKTLSDAIADKDPIYAVIRGGAVNHDGRSNGLTQPNRWAQEQLLRRAFDAAEIDPAELDYIELHGTGTLIGDPIEANALNAVLTEKTRRNGPCLVGSVKTNFGHLEAAAGIAGLVKLVLSIHYGKIPPSLWFDAPNPYIPFDRIALRVNTELKTWDADSGRRLGAVSSFGLGGTNASLVLESSPYAYTPARDGRQEPRHCLFITARSEVALKQLVRAYIDFLQAVPEDGLAAVCSSALRRKGIHESRLCVFGSDRATLIEGLRCFAAEVSHTGVLHAHCRQIYRKVLIALPEPTRIEAQRLCRDLLDAPQAREAWNACREILDREGWGTLPALDEAVQNPSTVGNDSNGHADARSDCKQARLWQFGAQYAYLRQLICGIETDQIEAIAAVGLSELAALCASGAIELDTALRWVCADDLRQFAAREELGDGDYCIDCVFPEGRNPRLSAVDSTSKAPQGAAGLLDFTALAAESAADLVVLNVESLTDTAHGVQQLFAQLALRYSLNWRVWANDHGFVRLPAYPWQRESFWLQTAGEAGQDALLGRRVESHDPDITWVWERQLNLTDLPYLADHLVQGATVMPGAGFVELSLAAQRRITGASSVAVERLEFRKALVLDGSEPTFLRVTFQEPARVLSIYSRRSTGDSWVLHASGVLTVGVSVEPAPPDVAAIRSRCSSLISHEAHYENMRGRGFDYGPYFQGVRQLCRDAGSTRVLAWIEGHEQLNQVESRHALHPTLLDSSLQALLNTLRPGDENLYIPIGFDRLILRRTPPKGFWCYGGLKYRGVGEIEGDFVLFDAQGSIAEGEGVRARTVTRRATGDPEKIDDWLYASLWQEQYGSARSCRMGRWLLVSNDAHESKQLLARLTEAGISHVTALNPGEARNLLEGAKNVELEGVIYAPQRSTQSDSPADVGDLLSLVELLPVLDGVAQSKSLDLIVLTCRAQALKPAEGNAPSQVPFVGLARVAVNEFPRLRVRAIDIDEESTTVAHLAAQLMEDRLEEEEVALRGDRRFVNRLVRRPAREWESERPTQLVSDGTYLITGGFGGFGLEVAKWLVSKGARYLTLVGRSGAGNPAAQQTVASLRQFGVEVLEVAADIADEASVQELLTRVQVTLPTLRGIFHAAAVLDDAPIAQLTRTQVETAMAAKARGAWHLHRYTRDLPLEHFVMFSSIASLVGGTGQASYVMACAYLDGLAHYRRARQLPAVSIHWGALGEVGMTTRYADAERYLRASGIGLLTPRQAVQLLDKAVRWNPIEIGMASMDWRAWSRLYPSCGQSPRYADLFGARPGSDGTGTTNGPPAHKSERTSQGNRCTATPEEREPLILEFLVESLARALQLAPGKIDRHAPLPSLGMDSMSAMDLQADMETQLAIKVPMLELMKGNSLAQLAQLINTQMGGPNSELQPQTASRYRFEEIDMDDAESSLGKLAGLADEDVERLLAVLTAREQGIGP